MSSPPLHEQSTLSTADPNRLGATPSNPIPHSSVLGSPNAEQFIVHNPAHGFYAVTAPVARMWRGYGYAILDAYGNRVNDFDSELNAIVARYADADRYEAFHDQDEEIWELLDMAAEIAELGSDETIVWDFETKRFKRFKKNMKGGNAKKGKDDTKRDPPSSPGAGATSSGATIAIS